MKIYLVGGAVRDQLLGLPIKERDYVVVGSTPTEMLARGFRLVGKEFPVFLHPETFEEYALARTERKVKPGYKGFEVDTSEVVTLEEDLRRRDLTINAMAIDLDTQMIIDPYGGQQAIADKMLTHVSEAFGEDPVRILRVGRFWARFAHLGFKIHPNTIALMRHMVARGEVNALVAERVFKELSRALREPDPQKFFETLHLANALAILFPHQAIDGPGIQALQLAAHHHDDAVIMFAVLVHAYPEINREDINTHDAIAALANRYRVPNAYRELAQLTARHYQTAFAAHTLSAEELLTFFMTIDIFRRKHRFQKFLQACVVIAQVHGQSFDKEPLQTCAHSLYAIDVQALIAQGYSGNELAQKLYEARLIKVKQWSHRSQ